MLACKVVTAKFTDSTDETKTHCHQILCFFYEGALLENTEQNHDKQDPEINQSMLELLEKMTVKYVDVILSDQYFESFIRFAIAILDTPEPLVVKAVFLL